jgi:hypothetical protein
VPALTGRGFVLRWTSVVLAWLAAAAGVLSYQSSDLHALHDPVHGLQQLDLLYLDQPAPLADRLGLQMGRPALVVVCSSCRPPRLDRPDLQVVTTDDTAVARAYALLTEDGRVGPGYALVDSRGAVRYRTFDPGLGQHAAEVQILVDALP